MKKQKSFLALWATQAVSLLGSQLVQFAVVWRLTKTTGSCTTLTLSSLASLLPQVLLGRFAGALVDRMMVMLLHFTACWNECAILVWSCYRSLY